MKRNYGRKFVAFLAALFIFGLFPVFPVQAADVVEIKIVDYEPTTNSGEGWSYEHDTLTLNAGYSFTLTNSAGGVGGFNRTVNNKGTIAGGVFYGQVVNIGGTIEDGLFTGFVDNTRGTIKYGVFNGKVLNIGGTIEDGTFNGVVKNSGTITGGVFYGGITETMPDDYRTVTVSAVTGGTIKVPLAAKIGDTITLTVTPDSESKHPIVKVTQQDSTEVTVSAGSGNGYQYSFSMPDQNVTVTASFEEHSFDNASWEGLDENNHKRTCTVCQKAKQTAPHTGGSATCTKQAVCADCGEAYGDYGEHNLELIPEKPATETEEGLKAHQKCEECSKLFRDGTEVEETDLVIEKLKPETKPDTPKDEPGKSDSKPSIDKKSNVPDTGDYTQVNIYVFALMISMAAMAGVVVRKKRRL